MMARMTYVIREGKLVEKHLAEPVFQDSLAPAVLPDIEPFVSPIDKTVIGSRSALRAHCKAHDVVPTEELKGLPPRLANPEYKLTKNEIRERREYIAYQVDKHMNRR
jgi:hypothetical protein